MFILNYINTIYLSKWVIYYHILINVFILKISENLFWSTITSFFPAAIAGGNCVIIKPPDLAPATCTALASLLPKYLDSECYPVYQGGIPETTELLKERFDYIFFTGSPQVGKIIYQAAAKHLTPTTLELGGKSPVYIDSTADIKLAAKRILWGKTINSGQTCIAPDYVLCSKSVQDEFINHVENLLEEFFNGKIIISHLR